jgi:ABC-type amino acid transport substrate-binding protein
MKVSKLVIALSLSTLGMVTMAQTPGELRLGVEAGYAPFAIKTADGKLAGFDIDLGNAICRELKRRCVWVENSFDGMIPALKTNRFDGILSAMSVTDKAQKEIYQDMLNGRLDGTLTNSIDANENLLQKPEGQAFGVMDGVISDPAIYNQRGTAIGLRKEDEALRTDLNKAIAAVKVNGSYKKLMASYFDFDISGD